VDKRRRFFTGRQTFLSIQPTAITETQSTDLYDGKSPTSLILPSSTTRLLKQGFNKFTAGLINISAASTWKPLLTVSKIQLLGHISFIAFVKASVCLVIATCDCA